MVCLIKSENKPLLDSYTDIIGSEDAAYYVLSLNNGYSLEFTPYGERSDLFRLLLAKNNYDYEEAVREKAEMYYSSFYNEIGGDWTTVSLGGSVLDLNGEPKIEYTPDNIDFANIISPVVKFDQSDYMNLSEIDENAIYDDMIDFIGDISNDSIEQIHRKKILWLKDKLKKLVDSINGQLLNVFGLEKKTDSEGRVFFVSKEKDESGKYKLIIQFCEYIENGKAGVYDLTGRLEAAANLIQISLTNADATTFNHELIHHYIRMFWNSDIVQKLAQKLDNGDRSNGWKVRLEERIVDEITQNVKDVHGFWATLTDKLQLAFRWLSSPIKQSLLRKASIAFRLNDKSLVLRQELKVLSFIDPYAKRVFLDAPNPLVSEFENTRSLFGIVAAAELFIKDSELFFEAESRNPNSIFRDQYNEYLLHLKNVLTGLDISDLDFNEVVVLINDFERTTLRNYSNPSDYHKICAYVLSQCISEARQIRINIRRQSTNIPAVHQQQNSQRRNEILKEVLDQIMMSLKTRVYEYTHTVPKEAQKANEVQLLIEKLNLIVEDSKKLVAFIANGTEELSKLYEDLNKLQADNFDTVSTQQLMSMWNAVEGFYRPVIDLINNELGSDEQTLVHDGILYELGVKLQNMNELCSIIGSKLKHANTIISQRETHKYLVGDERNQEDGVVSDLLTDAQKERFLNNFDDLLIVGKLFEDINMILPYAGLASRSRSLVIRIARNMILSANSEIRKATLKDAARIITLYVKALPEMRKLGLKELQSVFQEMDENGIPTGYFVRQLNHGKFYKDLDDYTTNQVNEANEKLKLAFGESAPLITYDYYNNPILPPDDDPTVKSILKEYSDNIDEWLCLHSDRMFTADYYRTRRLMLSPTTRQALSNVLSRINLIMSKCPTVKVKNASGKEVEIKATWELTPEDQQNLISLQTEYQQLGNQYYSDGTRKQDAELKIALEILKFNKWKEGKIKYNQDSARFESAIEEIRKKYGNNSNEERRFRKLNTTLVVSPDYYEYVLSKVLLSNDTRLEELRQLRNDLKKLIENFDKRGIDIEQKRRQLLYWDQLKDIDRQITELLESSNGNVDEENRWSTYFEKEFVMYDDNTTLLDHMLQQDAKEYKQLHPADTRSYEELRKELIQKYQYTYTWHDKSGNEHEGVALASVFTRTIPKGASINNGNLDAKFTINNRGKRFNNAIEVRYNLQFSDVNPESPFYNKDYDRNSSSFVQPKSNEYKNNSQWDLIQNNENILALYNALVELMQRNYSMLPNSNADSYKLPLMTGRRLTILRRSSGTKELFDALKYNWKNEWQLNDRDDDINYEDEKIRIRANGTRINTVPVRYIKMLQNKKAITSDVIGSIIAFTEMTNNFVTKTQLSSELEVIKLQLMDRENLGVAERRNKQTTKNIVKQLTNMMDDLLYGNTTKIGDTTRKFSTKQQRLIKFMKLFLLFGRRLMLGYNLTSMHVGFWESAIRGFLEALLGKDYTLRDWLAAWSEVRKNFLAITRQVGKYEVTNIQIAKMQWFGVSKSLRESYHSTERNRYIKLLSENIDGMFGFSMGDYLNSSFQLTMALNNVRFIEGDANIKTGFYTKHTLIKAYQKSGLSYKDAKKQAFVKYNQSGKSLNDAYELKDGILRRKAEYAPYISDILENRVTGKCYQRLAEALGVVPKDDNPGYGLQILLRPIGVLRNYLFTVIARNWNWAHDLQHRYIDENGKVVKENDMLDGYIDIDAGNSNIGLHQGLYEWMKIFGSKLPIIEKYIKSPNLDEEARDVYNYAAKKVLLEVLSIVTLVGISTLFKALARGADDDDWWQKFGYLTSVRLVNSFISVLDPTSLLEIIKNISTLISPLNDIINSIMILSDCLGLSGHSPLEEIKSGSYKDHTRLFRNLMRITPLGNMYEDLSSSALKSRTNWYLQQDPLVWSSVGGMFDLLWGTDSEGFKTKKK